MGNGTGWRTAQGLTLWERITATSKAEGDCLICDRNPVNRYPAIKIDGKMRTTHRLSWEIHFGPIPKGLCVCHRCDRPRCVNPKHLFLATSEANTADKVSKNRQARGERLNAKLTANQVREMRRLYDSGKFKAREIYPRFGIGRSAFWYIVGRYCWKHVP